ncbi:hypothetical protein Dimus_017643 [Dionaea muscipula]
MPTKKKERKEEALFFSIPFKGMKVPLSSTQNSNSASQKPLSCGDSITARNTTFNTNAAANTTSAPPNSLISSSCCYEPTSVLDLRSCSPTVPPPSAAVPTVPPDVLSAANSPPPVDLDNLDGWDSILTELGLNDDSNSSGAKTLSSIGGGGPCGNLQLLTELLPSQPFDQTSLISPDQQLVFSHELPYDNNQNLLISSHHNFGVLQSLDDHPGLGGNNFGFGFDFIDDLIQAAQSFESNNSHHVQLILARLNQRLRSPAGGKPLQRAAFYFKEALQSLLTGSSRPVQPSSYEIVQIIRCYKVFCGISPIPLFSTFAANQAILEAIDGATFIHIVDFDVGFGGHWASLMREIVDKADGGCHGKSNSIVLRITAVVPEEFGVEGRLVRENLVQFARELNINFHIEYVLIRSFQILSFKSIKFIQGEKLAVHLSPAMFHRLGSRNNISKFVGDLRSVSPHIVVVVDREVGIDTGTSSFSLNFVAGLEFYTAMMESLDAGSGGGLFGGGGGGGDWVRKIEMFLLRPRISAAVEAAGRRGTTPWREVLLAAGAKVVGPSQFAEFQGECLLRRLRIGGFHVAKQQGELLLCWHDRPLVAMSAWRC